MELDTSDADAEISASRAVRVRSRRCRIALGVVGAIGVLLGFCAWAFASPIGASPDEDYHLASIWCPRPIAGSGCAFAVEDGVISEVEVPSSIAGASTCVWGDANSSSGCIEALSDSDMAPTKRFDDGGYPWGYYQFQHLFVGTDVEHSVLNMRVINVVIGVGTLLVLGALARPSTRHNLLVATVTAWVPMGVYFVASVNPSSWSISGTIIFAAGLYVSTETEGWRRYLALILSAVGALLCVTSRGDVSFFVFVAAVAVWIVVPITRDRLVPLVFSVSVSLIGFVALLTTGQAGNISGDGGWGADSEMSFLRVFMENFLTIPEHVGRYWGLVSWGGPWLDIPVMGWSTITMMLLAGGLIFVGLSNMFRRKALATLFLFAALVGIPTVSMTLRSVYPLQQYQGRYMLPLLAVVFFVLLLTRSRTVIFSSTAQLVVLTFVVSVANGFALQRVMRKHVIGLDGRTFFGFGTFGTPQWWPWGIAPEVSLWGGAFAFAAGVACLILSNKAALNHLEDSSQRMTARTMLD